MATSGIEGLDTPPERLPEGVGRAETRLRRLKVLGRDYYVLTQRGSFPDIAYDHGRLLAKEIEAGVFPEILASIARGTDLGDPVKAAVGRTLFHALGNRILESVTDDFRAAVDALAAGYRDGMASPRFSRQDVVDALLAIEIEDIADGIGRRLAFPGLIAHAETVAEVAELCLRETQESEIRTLLGLAARDVLHDAAAQFSRPVNRSGMACTGLSVPAAMTKDRRHLHARNLDADLYKWNDAPAIFLVDETPAGHRHRYVAFGTLGLIYPGGISGINDAGIAVSLHQMSTTQYRLGFDRGRAHLAPFLQQCVLRDAGSLDEAVAIMEAAQNVSAWTILCSDAKSGRAARVEFNGRDTRVSPLPDAAVSQANHFLHPDLVEHRFDARDAHFTPSLGKWLETRTRMTMVDAALKAGTATGGVDLDWAIDLLSSGEDPELAGAAARAGLDTAASGMQRSFGRVPRKAYGQLTTVVRGDPARRPGADEAWMTVGDRLPGCQGTLVGWRIDWEKLDLAPVDGDALRRTRQYVDGGRANWELSFERYLAARVAVVRPLDAAGAVLSCAPTPAESADACRRAEALLTEAIALAEQDRIVEIPYHYLRARVRHELADYAGAAQDWEMLLGIWRAQASRPAAPAPTPFPEPRFRPVLHEYEAALSLALSVATEDKRSGGSAWAGRAERLAAAADLLAAVRQRLFGEAPAHFALVAWIDRVAALAGPHPEAVKLPEPEFVTVE